MKAFLVCSLVAFALIVEAKISAQDEQKMKTFYDECVASTGADKELITKARKGEFHENDKLMAYYGCMMSKLHFQDDDGKIHADRVIAKLPDSVDVTKGTEIINKCVKVEAGVSKNKAAYQCFKCFIESVGKPVKFF